MPQTHTMPFQYYNTLPRVNGEDKGHVSKKCIFLAWKRQFYNETNPDGESLTRKVVATVQCCMMDVSELPRAAACCLQVRTITVILFSIIRELLRGGRGGCGLRRVMDREHGVNIVITLRRHSASSTLLGWSPLLTSARSSCVMCPSYDASAAINETTFKIWNSRANFTVYIVFVICPKLDHFLFNWI